jgi:hypothetical protein
MTAPATAYIARVLWVSWAATRAVALNTAPQATSPSPVANESATGSGSPFSGESPGCVAMRLAATSRPTARFASRAIERAAAIGA